MENKEDFFEKYKRLLHKIAAVRRELNDATLDERSIMFRVTIEEVLFIIADCLSIDEIENLPHERLRALIDKIKSYYQENKESYIEEAINDALDDIVTSGSALPSCQGGSRERNQEKIEKLCDKLGLSQNDLYDDICIITIDDVVRLLAKKMSSHWIERQFSYGIIIQVSMSLSSKPNWWIDAEALIWSEKRRWLSGD